MDQAATIELLMQVLRKAAAEPNLAFSPTLRLDQLPNYDSVMAIQIVLGIEDRFGRLLSEDEIETMQTLDDVRRILGADGQETPSPAGRTAS